MVVNKLKMSLFPNGDVTQWFGENKDLYARFGLNGHNGIDIVRPWGSEMFAVEDGTVVSVKNDPEGYGQHVRIVSTPDKDGYANEWTYGHNSKNLVEVNQTVKKGDKVALMGNTGFVVSGQTPFWKNNPYAGTHVHFGLRKVKVLNRGGFTYPGSTVKLEVQNYDNGYKGAVDPYAFLVGLTKEQEQLRTEQKQVISLATKLKNLLWDKKAGLGIFAKK